MTFTPAGLFGATARCSCLQPLDPLAVTPESEMIRAMVERHVDESSSEFFLLDSVSSLKDFMRSHFSGSVAAGLSYLLMIGEGYVWADHFELQSPRGDPAVRAGPDFVFAGPQATGVALVESKGTTSDTSSGIDRRTQDGYLRQIEPHLGYAVGAAIATHGYAVGAWMTPTLPPAAPKTAEMVLHYTALRRSFAGAGPATAQASTTEVTSVIAGNYATACDLVFGPGVGGAIRHGRPFDAVYDIVDWLGEQWLVPSEAEGSAEQSSFGSGAPSERWLFALHHETAMSVFARSSFGAGVAAWTDFQMNPVIENLAAEAVDRDSQIFPDGLAVIARAELRRHLGGVRGHRGGPPPSSGLHFEVVVEPTTARLTENDMSSYSAASRPGLRTTGEFEV